MALDKSTRMKTALWLRYIRWLLLILIGCALLTQSYWEPFYDSWRCERIASELNLKYGIVVRYGDPSEFCVPPLQAPTNSPEEGFFIGYADKHSALTAIKGVESGLKKYPKELIQKYLKAVFISGIIKINNVQGSGTYLHSWVYLSAIPEYEPLGSQVYEKTFHHELSSLLLNGADFPADQWGKINEVTFKYLERQIDIINAAAIESRHDPKNAPSWHRAGFVHDYGMVSMENDFNMYVELAMTHPQRLKELSQKYPKIKAKTQILVEFYTSLAPELGAYFKSVGLADLPPTGHYSN